MHAYAKVSLLLACLGMHRLPVMLHVDLRNIWWMPPAGRYSRGLRGVMRRLQQRHTM